MAEHVVEPQGDHAGLLPALAETHVARGNHAQFSGRVAVHDGHGAHCIAEQRPGDDRAVLELLYAVGLQFQARVPVDDTPVDAVEFDGARGQQHVIGGKRQAGEQHAEPDDRRESA